MGVDDQADRVIRSAVNYVSDGLTHWGAYAS